MVMATQNPLEHEGVYRLPEAQLDRFMMKLIIEYNSEEEELEIMRRVANRTFKRVEPIISSKELEAISNRVERVHIDPEVESLYSSLGSRNSSS